MEHLDIYEVEPILSENSKWPTYIDDRKIEFKKDIFDLELFSYTNINGLFEHLNYGTELEFKGSEPFSFLMDEPIKNNNAFNFITCNAEDSYLYKKLFIYEQLNSSFGKIILKLDSDYDLGNDKKPQSLKANRPLPWKAKHVKANYKDEVSSATKHANKAKLQESFLKEKARFEAKGCTIASNDVEEILYMVDILAHLPFEKCALELSGNISVKITLVFTNDRILMLSKKMNQEFEGESKDDIFYSYFINRNMITSDVANFQNYITKFKEYIS